MIENHIRKEIFSQVGFLNRIDSKIRKDVDRKIKKDFDFLFYFKFKHRIEYIQIYDILNDIHNSVSERISI